VLTESNARDPPLAGSRPHPALADTEEYCGVAHPQQRLGERPVWTHVATPRRAEGGSGSAAPNRPGERARLRERGACAARPRRRPDAIRWRGSALRRRRRGSRTWVRDLSDIDRCPTSSGHRKRIASLPDSAATARLARPSHVRSTIAELHAGGKRAFPLTRRAPAVAGAPGDMIERTAGERRCSPILATLWHDAHCWDTVGTRITRTALTQQRSPAFAGLSKADDGTRTHDLLHGKQTL
jgi:hypothetical protein